MPCLTSKAAFQVATRPGEFSGGDRRVGCSRIVSAVMDEGHDGQFVGMETLILVSWRRRSLRRAAPLVETMTTFAG
jgi:hypothetical protein